MNKILESIEFLDQYKNDTVIKMIREAKTKDLSDFGRVIQIAYEFKNHLILNEKPRRAGGAN